MLGNTKLHVESSNIHNHLDEAETITKKKQNGPLGGLLDFLPTHDLTGDFFRFVKENNKRKFTKVHSPYQQRTFGLAWVKEILRTMGRNSLAALRFASGEAIELRPQRREGQKKQREKGNTEERRLQAKPFVTNIF
jgi:hypothetical protein